MTNGTYNLDLGPQKRSIFVTQLHEREYEDGDEDYNAYPVVKEAGGKLLETGLNTLQKTLLLKKQVEVEQVDAELQAKREEFRARMEKCTENQLDLQKRQQSMKDRVIKFDKFIKENEAKRRRAIQKYHSEVKVKEQRTTEYEELQDQLDTLRERHIHLEKKLAHYKKYHDYLTKVVDNLPENYIEMNDNIMNNLMMRHQTLSDNNQALVANLEYMADQVEALKSTLDEVKQNHDKTKLSINSRLSQMQKQQEDHEEKNKQTEETRINKHDHYRDRREILGKILMSIDNISQKCLKREQTSVGEWTLEKKLRVIQEYMVEREDVYRMSSVGTRASTTPDQRRVQSATVTNRARKKSELQ